MNKQTSDTLASEALVKLKASLGRKLMPVHYCTSAETHEQLGRLVVAFQSVESTVVMFLRVLLDTDLETATALTANASFRNLCSTLEALANRRNLPEAEMVTEAMHCARKAEELRNGLLHSSWIGDLRIKRVLRAGASARHVSEEFSNSEMRQIVRFIEDVDSCVATLMFVYIRRRRDEGKTPHCVYDGSVREL